MPSTKKAFFIASIVAVLMLFTGSPALAQLTWGPGGAGGSGTWDSSTSNWYNGASNVQWVSGDTGTFSGIPGTVTISGTQTASQLTFSNTGTYTLMGGALGVSPTTGLTVETDDDAAINSNINDLGSTGTLTKTGTGALVLTGTNTFTSLDVTTGVVVVTTTGLYSTTHSLGQGTVYLGVAGTSSGTLNYFGRDASPSMDIETIGANITAQGNGSDTINVSGTTGMFGQVTIVSLTLAGTISINHSSLTLTGTQSEIELGTPVQGTTDSVLNVAGIGVFLTSTNNTVGTIQVSGNYGALYILVDDALSSNTAVILSGGGSLRLGLENAVSETISSLVGDSSTYATNTNSSGISNLTINNTSADTFNGHIGDGVDPFNNLSITKTGAGNLTLTQGNPYSGGTMVIGGTLTVSNTSGSGTGTGTLTVSSGATIGGSGTINSSNNTINGNVQVGAGGIDTASILTMTATSSTTFSGANLVFNLNTTNLRQGNELALGATPSVLFSTSTLTFNLQGGTPIADGTQYTLLTSSVSGSGVGGSIFGGDISLSGSDVITGLNVDFNTPGYANSYLMLVADGSGYDIDLITGASAVPEPGTWALLLGGLALLGFCQIRQRRQKS